MKHQPPYTLFFSPSMSFTRPYWPMRMLHSQKTQKPYKEQFVFFTLLPKSNVILCVFSSLHYDVDNMTNSIILHCSDERLYTNPDSLTARQCWSFFQSMPVFINLNVNLENYLVQHYFLFLTDEHQNSLLFII